MAKSVATLLREKDMIKKSGLKKEVAEKLCADIDAQIEELASQVKLPLESPKGGK